MSTFRSIRLLLGRIRLTGPLAGWSFRLEQSGQRPYLQVLGQGICNDTGKTVNWSGGKRWLSYHMTDNEIIRVAWGAVQAAMLHEMQECFYFDDARIFDPHLNYADVAHLMKIGEIRQDVRLDSINRA